MYYCNALPPTLHITHYTGYVTSLPTNLAVNNNGQKLHQLFKQNILRSGLAKNTESFSRLSLFHLLPSLFIGGISIYLNLTHPRFFVCVEG